MDRNDSPIAPPPKPIYIQQINSLIMPGDTEATTKHVALILGVLAQVRHLNGVTPDADFGWGMNLIHEWLKTTIEFVRRHPGVTQVNPVARKTAQGGAS